MKNVLHHQSLSIYCSCALLFVFLSFHFSTDKSFQTNIIFHLLTKYGTRRSFQSSIDRIARNFYHSNQRYLDSVDILRFENFDSLGFLFGQWCLGAHQEYQTCGSACPLSCADVRTARYHKPCTYQCIQGCFCKRGYARRTHQKSQCIPDWRC